MVGGLLLVGGLGPGTLGPPSIRPWSPLPSLYSSSLPWTCSWSLAGHEYAIMPADGLGLALHSYSMVSHVALYVSYVQVPHIARADPSKVHSRALRSCSVPPLPRDWKWCPW